MTHRLSVCESRTTHYDHHHVAADHEVAFPVIHFHQLAKDGVIGGCYPWLFSFMGYLPEPAN